MHRALVLAAALAVLLAAASTGSAEPLPLFPDLLGPKGVQLPDLSDLLPSR